MIMNPILAQFDATPALVEPYMASVFAASAAQAHSLLERISARQSSDPALIAMEDDFWFAPDDWRSAYRPYVVKDGILHVPIKGVLMNDFPWQLGSWATGYEYIFRTIKRGMSDGSVKGVAFVENSPGGAVAGNFELVDKIFAMRGQKPMRAFAAEHAYSAAYSIASAADKIIVSRTGGVGSIGVVTSHLDISGEMAQRGWKLTFIKYGAHKTDANPYEPLTKEAKERIQARIDELGEIFVSTVARNRGMSEDAVRATQALTYSAKDSLSVDLADEIGSLEDALAAYAVELNEPLDEDEEMTTKPNETTAAASAAPVDVAALTAAAREEGLTAGRAEGAVAERTRISAIINSDEGKKRPVSALNTAFNTDMSADKAVAFLGNMPAEGAATEAKPNAFLTEMNKEKAAEPGAPGSAEQKNEVSRAERAAATAFGKARTTA